MKHHVMMSIALFVIVNVKTQITSKMQKCKGLGLNKINRHRFHAFPAPKSSFILVENRKHELTWTACCIKDNCCHLCDTGLGWAFIESVVNELLFGKYHCADVKVVAKVENIWE
jgi:hypothetical protein